MLNSITFPGLKVDSIKFGTTEKGEAKCRLIAHEIGKKDCPSYLLIAKGNMAEYIEKACTREGDYVSVTGHVSMWLKDGKSKLDIVIENFFNMGNIDKQKEQEIKERQMAKNTICFFDLIAMPQEDTTAVKFARAANGSQTATFTARENQGGMIVKYAFQAFDEAADKIESLTITPGDHISVKAVMQPYEKKDANGNTTYCTSFKVIGAGKLAAKSEVKPQIVRPKTTPKVVAKTTTTTPADENTDVFRTPLGDRHFG